MHGFLTFTGGDEAHLLELPRSRFTFGSEGNMDLTIGAADVPAYCGSLTWDEARGSWALELDSAARGKVRLNGVTVSDPSLLLEDGSVVTIGGFSLRFDLLPDIPTMGGRPMRVIELAGNSVRIGRGNEEQDAAKIVLDPEDGDASRSHATLEKDPDGGWYIRDHSHAGTELNGQTFERERLVVGDRFRIGHYIFEFTGRSLRRLPTSSAGRLVATGLSRVVPGGKRILNDVNLDVPPGSFVGLLGGSGQGKSTLMTALCGLNPATAGEVLLNGVKLNQGNAEAGRIGFVPQDDIVHSELTVRQAITFSARLRLPDGPPRPQIDALVLATAKRLSLEPHLDKRVSKLSGGQRKRVSIGTEMLVKPSVLFLDEPSSGLDPATEFYLMSMLRDLAGADCTVLCTTHILGFAHLFDRIAFVQAGRMVFYGRPDDAPVFFERPEWVDIYLELEQSGIGGRKTAEEWERAYQASPVKPQPEPAIPLVHDQGAAPPARRPGTWRTLCTLMERQWAILVADKLNIAFLLAQALAIAALIGWAAPADGLRSFLSVVAVLWFGCSNAAQQIVAELPIFRRERVCGLGLNVYLQSKLVFTLAVTFLQALVLFVLVTLAGHLIHHEAFDDEILRRDARLGGEESIQEIQVEETPGKGLKELRRLFGFSEDEARSLLQRFITGQAVDPDSKAPVLDDQGRPMHVYDEKTVVLGAQHLARQLIQKGESIKSRQARDHITATLQPGVAYPAPVSEAPARPGKTTTFVMLKLIGWFGLQENVLDSAERPMPGDLRDPVTNLQRKIPAQPLSRVVVLPVLLRLVALLAAAAMGVAMGLTISALVRSPTQAVMWVPLILIPQILFGGYVVTRPEMDRALRTVSSFVPSAAAQSLIEVATLQGQSVPGMTNRHRIPAFMEPTQREAVTWMENGTEEEEDEYERPSPANTAFQNLVVNADRVGQRHIEQDDAGDAPFLVKTRADVKPYRQGTLYTDLRPARWSGLVILGWIVTCYGIAWFGLRKKQPL